MIGGSVPLPDNGMIDGFPVALWVIDIFAVLFPVDVGLNEAVKVLVPPATIVQGNPVVFPNINWLWSVPVRLTPLMVKFPKPLFVIVNVCEDDVEPAAMLPKL
jgi:hypothetical protein